MLEKFICNPCENSLTAAVFSHLLHLPSEMFWRILSRACYGSLPNDPGEPLLLKWPNWEATGTDNSDRVIPDLFMRFDSFDLIIEAKRRDNCMQSPEQWKKEVAAYANEYGNEHVPVRMIALGGIWETRDAEVSIAWPISKSGSLPPGERRFEIKCPVHMCQWSTVLHECQLLQSELEETDKNNPSSQTSAHLRILNDLIAFFTTHGYAALRWFADFDFKSNLLDNSVDSDQQCFQNISLKFRSLL